MLSPRAGTRNCLVTFYRPTVTAQNSSGEDVVSNVQIGRAWVQIMALVGKELEIARQLWAEARFRLILDHPLNGYTLQRADIVTWGTRTLDILDAEDPDQQRRQVIVTAKELVP